MKKSKYVLVTKMSGREVDLISSNYPEWLEMACEHLISNSVISSGVVRKSMKQNKYRVEFTLSDDCTEYEFWYPYDGEEYTYEYDEVSAVNNLWFVAAMDRAKFARVMDMSSNTPKWSYYELRDGHVYLDIY